MRKTGRMLDWGSGGDDYEEVHPGMDSLDLDYGRPKKLAEDLIHYELEACEATPLPVPDGYYHYIRSNFSFDQPWKASVDSCLTEMKRVLAVGGTIRIHESSEPEDYNDRRRYKRYITNIMKKNFPYPEYYCDIFWKMDKDCHPFLHVLVDIEKRDVDND